jgi:hypothetical protein
MKNSEQKIYRKIVGTILLGMLAAVILLNVWHELMDASKGTILSRVNEAQLALPQILEEEDDLVMFFGSSMVQAGFSPRMFDHWLAEEGIDVKSFNFGFGGLNPYFQDFLVRRIADDFKANDRRLELVMIEFNPFQTTQTRWNGAQPIVDTFLTMLATDAELFEIAKTDLRRGVRLFNIRYFRNGISAEAATQFLGQSLQTRPERSEIPEDEEAEARQQEINELLDGQLAKDYPDYDGSDWYYPWQGGGTIPMDRSEQTVELIKELITLNLTDNNLDNDRMGRIRTADIIDLNFEELLVESFINLVKTFQGFSDRVEVILLPTNSDWIKTSPEGQARLDKVLARIEAETGVKIRSYQGHPGITPQMFSDTTHLGRYTGDIPFTRILTSDMATVLKNP